MKKIVSAILLAALVLMSFSAFAADVTVTLDGEELSFDVDPVIIDGRTLVPMRGIFEALGFEVSWDAEQSAAIAVRSDRAIITVIDNSSLIVITDGPEITELDVPAQLIDGRTLVPVRAISEGSGCKVNWNDENRTVEIVTVQ